MKKILLLITMLGMWHGVNAYQSNYAILDETSTIQPGNPTIWVASGTVNNLNASTFTVSAIQWPNGTIQVSSPTAGGGSFINNQATLQSGATFYVSSGTVQGQLTVGTINSSTITLNSGSGITGFQDGSNAPQYDVGESSRAYGNAVNAGGTGTWTNIAQITLTAGDWDISGVGLVTTVSNTSYASSVDVSLSVYSGGTTTDAVLGDNHVSSYVSGNGMSCAIPSWRVSITSPTTYYLKAEVGYINTAPTFSGRISARRIR